MNSDGGDPAPVALALSFANLVYLKVWFDLLSAPADPAYIKYAAGSSDYLAATANVALLAAATWTCLHFSSRMPVWLRYALLLLGFGLAANAIRGVASIYTPLLRSGALRYLSLRSIAALAAIMACGFAYLLVRRLALVRAFARGVLLTFLPAMPITCGTALYRAVFVPTAVREPALADPWPAHPSRKSRVMWAIFDEWDNRLSFASRRKGVELSALDRLAARSLVGTHVLGPQGRTPVDQMATQVATPSLLAGEPRKSDDFHAPHLFSLVHGRGQNVAAAGWYIPYCRLFAGDVFRCFWDQKYTQSTVHGDSFRRAMVVQGRSLIETSMFSMLGQSFTSERHAAEYQSILNFALDAAADPSADLVFLHFNVPHAPYFYDAASGRLDAPGRSVAGYGDALMLVDRTVAKLMDRLDTRTVLILSADHPLRNADQVDGLTDPHVPFIVHFPGQIEGVREEREFSSIRTAAMILKILDGKLSTPEEAAELLAGMPITSNTR